MKTRCRIGLVVATITDSFSNRIAKGAMAAAEKLDADLFIFPVKYFDLDYNDREIDRKYEYQYNALTTFAAEAGLDYLIVCTGTIVYLGDDARKKEILDRFAGTPVLNVASKIDGYDHLIYDNRSGITEAVNFLAAKQGRKHICMMAGDLNNMDCRERFEAYRKALDGNGLAFEDRMYIQSDLSNNCVTEACALLDANPECDALVCANDDIASVFYDILRKRRKSIGKDILLVGFDDVPFASKMDPPLASVKADAYDLGHHSVEKVVNILNGVPDNEHLHKTEFIPRASCSADVIFLNKMENIFKGTYTVIAENIMNYVYQNNVPTEQYESIHYFCTEIVRELERRVIRRNSANSDYEYITAIADDFFAKNRYDTEIVPRMVNILDGAFFWLSCSAPEYNIFIIQKLFKYFILKISAVMINDFKNLEDKHREHIHDTNVFIRDTLMFSENTKLSYSQMLCKTFCVNIRSSYLYLLSEPIRYLNGEMFPGGLDWKFMAYEYHKQCHTVPDEEQSVSSHQMYKNKYIPSDERHTFIIADLYSREYQYGMLMCEPDGYSFFDDLELVVYEVSAAVKLIRMINEQDRMVEKLNVRNLALESMSEIDELTGIYNRRGFYKAAEKYINEHKNSEFIVCYADMDNLKLVNDGHGHSEGDFSIKHLAKCLEFVFGEKGITGRMGGDEFAALILKDDTVSTDSIIQKKNEYIEALNKEARKSYRIGMSMGLYQCRCENSYDLKTAMDKADGVLYGEKAKRKKEI